jgi:hypothetical protein
MLVCFGLHVVSRGLVFTRTRKMSWDGGKNRVAEKLEGTSYIKEKGLGDLWKKTVT